LKICEERKFSEIPKKSVISLRRITVARMGKIDDFIKQHSIRPSDCLYHTSRSIRNKKNQMAGKIRVLAAKSDSIARVEYKCPECLYEGYVEQEWKRPFAIKCQKCGAKITVPKMKDQAKKELKAENAAMKD
jgi:DNA-directed RNA polymerase subunit RPC12/RpoP